MEHTGELKSVRWGIIGCGDVVEHSSGPSLQATGRSALVAVMRRSEAKVRNYAAKCGIPFWTTDAQEVIEHPEVNAVYIATPPDRHLEYALRVCKAGKACLVEKPVGRSSAENERIARAFRERGVDFFASYYRRYLPKFEKVRKLLESGRLGPIVAINYRYSRPMQQGNWRTSPQIGGGGLFFDSGCHTLDLLDYWFGPLEFMGGSAVNASPAHEAEDAVSIAFRTGEGAVGSALWNFTGTRRADALVIEGLWGKLAFACKDPWSSLTLEMLPGRVAHQRASRGQRLLRKIKGKKKPGRVVTEYSFERMPLVYQPMFQGIVDTILDKRDCRVGGEAAVRTSRLMDSALAGYYQGRDDPFWDRPQTWHSLRANALRRADRSAREGRYVLSSEQLRFYEENGYLGPFTCEVPGLDCMHVPDGDRLNLHLADPYIFELCAHPSVVNRVSQLLGSQGISLMKTRIRVKSRQNSMVVPWQRDVGLNNGGVRDDGSPVPTVTVWLSIDGATGSSGAVRLIPGSHRHLPGNWKSGIQAQLEKSGAMDEVDMSTAVTLETRPGEFYIFHSWVLHGSAINRAGLRRTALNMCYCMQGDEWEPEFEYVPMTSLPEQPVG